VVDANHGHVCTILNYFPLNVLTFDWLFVYNRNVVRSIIPDAMTLVAEWRHLFHDVAYRFFLISKRFYICNICIWLHIRQSNKYNNIFS
jgi:hypothetical protein